MQLNKEPKMDFALATIRILSALLALMILKLIAVSVLQPPAKPSVIETYSTSYAAFAVVDGSAETGCDLPAVKFGAVTVDQNWTGYVYGPPPGVPCARPRPSYRSQIWCRAPADCFMRDIDKRDWDALMESARHTFPPVQRL
jgi:hypothetical protein